MDDMGTVDVSVSNGIGRLLLNRPKALNAITQDMVLQVATALKDWAANPAVHAVLIEGAGEKAFCAGGDVVTVSKAGQAQSDIAKTFFQEEYRLNRAIELFEKPYIAFLDGIVMGGGVGLSVHGNHRIATERTLFAMPETGIGLFPDVGGSHFLSRCPGETGVYLGLTGARLKAADLLALGLVDAHMPSDARDAFVADLEALDWQSGEAHALVSEVTAKHVSNAGEALLSDDRAAIDALFAGNDLLAIYARLEAAGSDFAHQALKWLAGKSPTLLHVTLEQLRRGAVQDFDANMIMEYRMVRRALQPESDFHEGVRALLIDKDKSPKWHPDNVADVSAETVAEFFEPPPEGDLTF